MKRYAICGLSGRGIWMFVQPLVTKFAASAQLVAMLDKDPLRFEVCRKNAPQAKGIPTYSDAEFDRMVAETKPDVIIVTGADHSHAHYVIAALEKGLDAIVEKPMTTNAADARRILDAEARSKGKVTVTFNYRYPAVHRKLKELMLKGVVGRVTSVDLNWYIDTYHGASYFKRWNRTRKGSGGLSLHKCSHHFDLIHWLLDQSPVEVFAYGALNYFGPNGPMNPRKVDGRHCADCPDRPQCAYQMRWFPDRAAAQAAAAPKDDHLGSLAPKGYTGYRPDMCVFDSEIDIEDTYTATIKYDKGAIACYSVNYSQPYEGYRLAINGTLGRIETQEFHAPDRTPFPTPEQTIEYLPLFGGARETILALKGEGGHGGGDPLLLEDIFLGPDPKRGYEIMAGAKAGALAVALGEGVWRSAATGQPVRIADLIG